MARDATSTLRVGDPAPDFELPTRDRLVIRLSDYRRRRHVVLLFYPLAFTPV